MHGQTVSFAPDRPLAPSHDATGTPRVVSAMRELARSGYAVDPDAEAAGLLLRHKVAPDLILHEDGAIELAISQPRQRHGRKAPRQAGRISWRRTFLVAFVGMVAWSSSVLLGVSILSS